jgi:hypothetical protein
MGPVIGKAKERLLFISLDKEIIFCYDGLFLFMEICA